MSPRSHLAVAIAIVLAGCGGAKTDQPTTPMPPRGHELVPVVVTRSTFWQTLDSDACPVIAKTADAPAGYEPWWPGLRAYCSSTPRTPSVVTLAGRIDREDTLAGIVKEITHSHDAPCKAVRAKLKDTPDLLQLADDICNRNDVTPDQVAHLTEEANRLAEVAAKIVQVPDSLNGLKQACTDKLLVFGEPVGGAPDLVAKTTALCTTPKLTDLTSLKEKAKKMSANAEALSKFAASANLWTADTRGSSAGAGGGAESSTVSISSMIDVALQGLGQFLAKRAELELRSYAIDKLRTIAECDKPADASIVHRLLDNTCEFLGGDTGTLPAGFGPGLRSAFVQDLTALPRNVAREVPARGGSSELMLRVALESAAVVADDPDPMQVVARILVLAHRSDLGADHQPKPEDEAFFCVGTEKEVKGCHDSKALLYVAAIMAREVLSDGPTIQLDGDQLLDRIAQRVKDIYGQIPEESELHALLKPLVDANLGSDEWKRLLAQLRGDGDAMIANLQAARAALSSMPPNGSVDDRAKAIVTSTRYALRGLDRATAIAACMKEIARVKRAVDCPTDRVYLPAQIAEFLDALSRKDITAVMASGVALARGVLAKTDLAGLLSPEVTRLLSFGAELANAKTSEEAEAAIETIAMPPGGYKEKRKRDLLSITGLVGIGGGYEWVASEDSKGWATTVIGAVGLDYNHHFERSKWTVGAYVTVLDLGGILNFGSDSDTTSGMDTKEVDNSPKVTVAQVFAPGVGIRFGISDSPVVLMLGTQVVPSARSVTDDHGTPMDTSDDTTRDRAVVRVIATFAVDVTIWAF